MKAIMNNSLRRASVCAGLSLAVACTLAVPKTGLLGK
jgi:hypothetical protein